MENQYNMKISLDDQGRIVTDDTALNNIIRSVEAEKGGILASVIPAVTFDDDPDEKVYLVLMTAYSNNTEDIKDWQIKIGRQNTYNYLRDLVKNEAIDPHESFVIVGTNEYDEKFNKPNVEFSGKPITVFRFLKVMFDNHKVLDDVDDFDINEYDPNNYEHGDITIME